MSALLANLRPQAPLSTDISTPSDARLFDTVPLADSLTDALLMYAAPDMRPRRETPLASDFASHTYTFDALNQYVSSGQWRALALASQATITQTPDPATALRLWVYRALAVTQLHRTEQVERELQRLSQVARLAQWPFELRVLRATIGPPPVAIDRLSALLRGCRRMHKKYSVGDTELAELFRVRALRVSFMLVGQVAALRDSALAAQLVDSLGAGSTDPLLLSAIARMHLQLGNVQSAERQFVAIEALVPSSDSLTVTNRALYAVATGKWEPAKQLFASICSDQPAASCVAAANNQALCELYLGNPQEMLNALQRTMTDAPTAAGTAESIVFNYCTGLDLHYDGVRLRDAKAKKMAEVGTWAGDGFDMASFKLQ